MDMVCLLRAMIKTRAKVLEREESEGFLSKIKRKFSKKKGNPGSFVKLLYEREKGMQQSHQEVVER